MDNNFIVPPLEVGKPLPSEREANDEAFYAASASTADPVADFHNAKTDLTTTGQSDIVDGVKKQWEQEQDGGNRLAIQDIMADQTVTPDIKKEVLKQFAMSKGQLSTSLKDRYIQKTAATDDYAETVHQKEVQDQVVNSLRRRREQLDASTREQDLTENQGKLQSFLSGMGNIYKGAGNTLGLVSDEDYKTGHDEYKKLSAANPISAGIGGAVGLISTALPAVFAGPTAAAVGLAAGLGGFFAGTSKYAELGQNPNISDEDRLNSSLANAGLTSAEFAMPIFRVAGILKTIAVNGGGAVALGELNVAVQNEILSAYPELKQQQLDPTNLTVNAVLGGLVGAVFGRPISAKGTPSIPPNSPAAVTNTANPAAAAHLAAQAVANPGSGIGQAMGTDVGAIVNDWALVKPIDDVTALDNPDLARNLKQMDSDFKEVFDDYRYDPNVINATKRDQDADNILQVVRENTGSYYQQSNSKANFTDHISEGTMVFGPDATSKFTTFKDANAAAGKLAFSIKQLPENERGTLHIVGKGTNAKGQKQGPYHLEWNWKKEYDDISNLTFGPDSVRTSVLGMDVSGVARSGLGKWLFPTGRFPKQVEQGAMRNIERTAKLEDTFIKAFDVNIAKSNHKVELSDLIDEAESLGVESFTKAEMQTKFPHLNTNQVNDLFESHTYWRRMNHYFYNFANREMKNKLVKDDMQGVYNDAGDYLGPATTKVNQGDVGPIQLIWDYGKNQAVKYDPAQHAKEGKTVVRMADKVEEPGFVHEFGLVGENSKLAMLPNEVLPKTPGYSPRSVRENFFVDKTPKALVVNGLRVTDPQLLRKYSRTVAAARNERDAGKLAEQSALDNPDHHVTVRPERQDAFGSLVADYQVHNAMFKQGQKRGERLPSRDGVARIDDRLHSAIRMTQSLSKMGSFRAWDDSFQSAFTKGFSKFLDNGQFPMIKTDIKPLQNMSRAEKKEFDTAQQMWQYYSKQKSFETLGDYYWKQSAHWIADVLEKGHIPAGAVRDLGKKGNMITKVPKMMTTALYIHLNPVRQWLIQPAQLMEMYAINPHTAIPMFHEMFTIRMALASDATLYKPWMKDVMKSSSKRASNMDPKEFDDTVKAIKDSGLMQSVDMNVLVHGMFKEVDRNLVESGTEAFSKKLEGLYKAPLNIARSVGFDAAEITNRVGLYLQAKELWKQQNPGKNWNTKENRETIAAEGLRLSGTMNRAGNLPYQEGALSVFFQFAAISQKLLMNLFQDNATIMTPGQRVRLAAVRSILYGAKYGLPGGALAYTLIEKSDNPEIKAGAEDIKRGLVDYVANNIIASQIDPDTPSDLAIGKSLTPYSENFLPMFDVGVETAKMFDGNPNSGPRYPAFGVMSSMYKAATQMNSWLITKDLNNEQSFAMAVGEAFELASGFNNYSKGLLMLGSKDIVTSNGNKLGFQTSRAEAYARMYLGSGTYKELDAYDYIRLQNEKKEGQKEMAKEIHQSLMNIRNKVGTDDFTNHIQRLNSFISLLPPSQFDEQDKLELIKDIMNRDKFSYTSTKQSIFADLWKHHSDNATDNMKKRMDILRRSKDPEVQKLVETLEKGKL